jgi:hypothetical protein
MRRPRSGAKFCDPPALVRRSWCARLDRGVARLGYLLNARLEQTTMIVLDRLTLIVPDIFRI